MSVTTYTPDSYKILHTTNVDFGDLRQVNKSIHVVQYDKSLPIIAVNLYSGGSSYVLPTGFDCKIRFGKYDGTYVYKDVLGCNEQRNVIYFDVDEDMTAVKGEYPIVIELSNQNGIASSSYINIVIDRNPIQNLDVPNVNIAGDHFILIGDTILTETQLKKLLKLIE